MVVLWIWKKSVHNNFALIKTKGIEKWRVVETKSYIIELYHSIAGSNRQPKKECVKKCSHYYRLTLNRREYRIDDKIGRQIDLRTQGWGGCTPCLGWRFTIYVCVLYRSNVWDVSLLVRSWESEHIMQRPFWKSFNIWWMPICLSIKRTAYWIPKCAHKMYVPNWLLWFLYNNFINSYDIILLIKFFDYILIFLLLCLCLIF